MRPPLVASSPRPSTWPHSWPGSDTGHARRQAAADAPARRLRGDARRAPAARRRPAVRLGAATCCSSPTRSPPSSPGWPPSPRATSATSCSSEDGAGPAPGPAPWRLASGSRRPTPWPWRRLAYLWPGLPAELRVPVTGYSLLLTAMACGSRAARTVAALGGALFLLSDTLIATGIADLAAAPRPDFWIMLTYLAAQYLLARGVLGAQPRVPPVLPGVRQHPPTRSVRVGPPDRTKDPPPRPLQRIGTGSAVTAADTATTAPSAATSARAGSSGRPDGSPAHPQPCPEGEHGDSDRDDHLGGRGRRTPSPSAGRGPCSAASGAACSRYRWHGGRGGGRPPRARSGPRRHARLGAVSAKGRRPGRPTYIRSQPSPQCRAHKIDERHAEPVSGSRAPAPRWARSASATATAANGGYYVAGQATARRPARHP